MHNMLELGSVVRLGAHCTASAAALGVEAAELRLAQDRLGGIWARRLRTRVSHWFSSAVGTRFGAAGRRGRRRLRGSMDSLGLFRRTSVRDGGFVRTAVAGVVEFAALCTRRGKRSLQVRRDTHNAGHPVCVSGIASRMV